MTSIEGLTQQIQELTDLAAAQVRTIEAQGVELRKNEAQMLRMATCAGEFARDACKQAQAAPSHDSDCSTNNRGVPELLGPCDCSAAPVAAAVVQGDDMPPHRKLMALLGMSANDDLHDIMAMAALRIERLQAAAAPESSRTNGNQVDAAPVKHRHVYDWLHLVETKIGTPTASAAARVLKEFYEGAEADAAMVDAKSVDTAEPDILWDAEDPENGMHGSSGQDFAENYASGNMSVGESAEVTVLCATRSHNRKMLITVTDGEEWLKWKWTEGQIPAAQPSPAQGDAEELAALKAKASALSGLIDEAHDGLTDGKPMPPDFGVRLAAAQGDALSQQAGDDDLKAALVFGLKARGYLTAGTDLYKFGVEIRDMIEQFDMSRILAQCPTSAAPTDMSKRLRELADKQLVANAATCRAAANEIERYYGGMLNWKQTAEAKDRQYAVLHACTTPTGAAPQSDRKE